MKQMIDSHDGEYIQFTVQPVGKKQHAELKKDLNKLLAAPSPENGWPGVSEGSVVKRNEEDAEAKVTVGADGYGPSFGNPVGREMIKPEIKDEIKDEVKDKIKEEPSEGPTWTR